MSKAGTPRRGRSLLAGVACYAWAGPTTMLGLVAGGMTLATRGHAQRIAGVLEFHGGFSRWLLDRTPIRASALTLGHVILAIDADALDRFRAHEHVHVRQAELWGPGFLPAYLASSAWAWLRGLDPYLANHFERQAYREADGWDVDAVIEATRRRGASAASRARARRARRSDRPASPGNS